MQVTDEPNAGEVTAAVAMTRFAEEDDVDAVECAADGREVGLAGGVGQGDGVRAKPLHALRLSLGRPGGEDGDREREGE